MSDQVKRHAGQEMKGDNSLMQRVAKNPTSARILGEPIVVDGTNEGINRAEFINDGNVHSDFSADGIYLTVFIPFD